MTMNRSRLMILVALSALLGWASTVAAQMAPPLGAAAEFGVLGNSGVTGATGTGAVVNGAVGSSPTPTISNFPPSTVVTPFIVHTVNDAVVQQAHTDAIAAYNALLIQGPGSVLADNLASAGALTPGIYSFATGAPNLPSGATLTLNGTGVFIFNVGSSLTANVLSSIVGTANPCNIFWRVGTSATLNGTNFRGTVIADASITIGAGSDLQGRALAGTGATGAVTIAGGGGNVIGGCSAPPSSPTIAITPTTIPTVTAGVPFTQTLVASGGTAPYTFTVVAGVLPDGVTLTAGGVLSGTPTTSGSVSVTLRATDVNGAFTEVTYLITALGVVPTMPQVLLVVLAIGLGAIGYFRLRKPTPAR